MDTAQRWTVSLVAVLSPLAAFGLLLWGVSADSDGPIWGFFLAAFLWIVFAPLGVLFGVRWYREKGEVAGLVLSGHVVRSARGDPRAAVRRGHARLSTLGAGSGSTQGHSGWSAAGPKPSWRHERTDDTYPPDPAAASAAARIA